MMRIHKHYNKYIFPWKSSEIGLLGGSIGAKRGRLPCDWAGLSRQRSGQWIARWLGDDLFLEIPWKTYPVGCFTGTHSAQLSWQSRSTITTHSQVPTDSFRSLIDFQLCRAICSQVCGVVKTALSQWRMNQCCVSQWIFIHKNCPPASRL